MSLTQVKVGLIGALLVAGVVMPAWQQTRLLRVQSENARLRAVQVELRTQEAELGALRTEVGRLGSVGAAPAELEQLRQWKTQTQPELLRLRGMAGAARQANLEAVQLRAQLAKQPGQVITGPMLEFQKQERLRGAEGELSSLKTKLQLTPEQSKPVRDILLRQAQADCAAMEQQSYTGGKYSKEEIARLRREAGDQDTQIEALLTPGQKAAYAGHKQDQAAHYARWSASGLTADLQDSLSLSPEQADQAFAALYQVTLAEFTNRAKSDGTNRERGYVRFKDSQAKALGSILTPAQLESFHRIIAAQPSDPGDPSNNLEGGSGSK